MPTKTSRLLSRGNGHTPEEEEIRQQRLQRDINLNPGIKGYLYAFKRDSVMTFEKSEYQKNNLGGIIK